MSQTTSIRGQRLRKGLTLRGLADQCTAGGTSVHYSQLARIEKGEHSPRPQLRAVLAKLLDLDFDDFDQIRRPADGATQEQAEAQTAAEPEGAKGRQQGAAQAAVISR